MDFLSAIIYNNLYQDINHNFLSFQSFHMKYLEIFFILGKNIGGFKMKVFNQIGILLGVWATGELVSQFIKNVISIPGSILGMIILFLLLQFKVISEEKIKDVADFLLGNMGIFFIPAGVSLIQSLGLIKENAILLLSCIILINIAVMIGCGKSVDFMIKLKEKKETKSKQEIA